MTCGCQSLGVFFFVKQKTAYEVRISDWSSDVCSSELMLALGVVIGVIAQIVLVHLPLIKLVARLSVRGFFRAALDALVVAFSTASSAATLPVEIGRAHV